MKRDAFARPDETKTEDGRRIRQYPEFKLVHSPDNRTFPSQITAYDPTVSQERLTTEWITASLDTAVPVEEIQ